MPRRRKGFKKRGWATGGDVSRYTQKTLKEEREYGFYWYSWLWGILRPILVFTCSMIIVVGVVASGVNYVNSNYFMAVDPSSTEEREFVIEQGSSITKISENLEAEKFIRSKSIFKTIISVQGLGNKIQYGSYPLSSGMNVNEVIEMLTAGSVTNERTITIIPGWTVEEIAEYLRRTGALKDTKEFLELCNKIDLFKNEYYALEQASNSGKLDGRRYQLEGYLAPDTYRVFTNATAESLLRTLLKQMDTVIDRVFYQPVSSGSVYDENGNLIEQQEEERFESTLTMEETIVLASVIEREAGRRADFAKVSAVFHNRLTRGMALESDATISYAAGINRLVLTSDELHTNSPYNSYLNTGLPIGPICNPSQAAIEAALYPDMGYITEEYLYFCTADPTTSELKFSKTKAEHDAAVAEYRPLWETYDQQQNNQ